MMCKSRKVNINRSHDTALTHTDRQCSLLLKRAGERSSSACGAKDGEEEEEEDGGGGRHRVDQQL